MPRRRRFRPNYPLIWAIVILIGAIVGYIAAGVVPVALTPLRPGMSHTVYLAFVAKCLDATLAGWFFAVGSSIGSFLNVVAYRLPIGKSLGGHSACPFCANTIASSDNVPVFAWLRLRGRCRTCRLPISIQYPLVELALGLAFLSVYFTEFGVAGTNLPGSSGKPMGLGLIWMSVSSQLATRVILYLFVLSGLVAAALMVVRHSQPPLSLFGWLAAPTILTPLISPIAIVVTWSSMAVASNRGNNAIVSHFDVLATLLCGLAGGLATSALTLPLISRTNNQPNADPAGIASYRPRGIGWAGTTACLGLLLGWQALPMTVLLIFLFTLLGRYVLSAYVRVKPDRMPHWIEPVAWSWLGLLVFRANWKSSEQLLSVIPALPAWLGTIGPIILALPLAYWVGQAYRLEQTIGATDQPVTDQPLTDRLTISTDSEGISPP